MVVNLGDARDRLSELVEAALNGEKVTICKRGAPAVDLVRSKAAKRRVPDFDGARGTIRVLDPSHTRKPETDADVEAWLRGQF